MFRGYILAVCSAWLVLNLSVDFTNSEAIDVTKCDAYAQRGNGIVCYTKTGWTNQWVSAQQQCLALKSHLLSIATAAETTAIAALLAKNTIVDTWLGATSFGGTWTWLDGSELQRQGCFLDNETNPDMPVSTIIPNMTPELCTNYCGNLSYAYAGLESGTQCSCGNSFGRYGQTGAQCVSPCPGAAATCGGPTSQDIIATQGSYSNWEPGQPDNLNQNQNCAVLDSSSTPFQWYDVPCTDSNWAICETSDPNFACTTQNGAVRLTSGSCVYLITQINSYFGARVACTARGGDLALLKTAQDGADVSEFISSTMAGSTNTYRYYIGLVKLQWKWESGEPFLYTNWGTNEPTAPGQGCTRMKANDAAWENVDCVTPRNFICQYTNNTQNINQPGMITVPSTTPRPTLGPALSAITGPTTQSTPRPITPAGGPGPNQPSGLIIYGASTMPGVAQAGAMNIPLVAGIAGGVGGFFLILIIIVIVLGCLRCRKAREDAEKNDNPAKNDIDIPSNYFFGIESENSNPPPHSPLMAGSDNTGPANGQYEELHPSGTAVHYDNYTGKADIQDGSNSTFKK